MVLLLELLILSNDDDQAGVFASALSCVAIIVLVGHKSDQFRVRARVELCAVSLVSAGPERSEQILVNKVR